MVRLVDRLSRIALHVTSIWLLLIHLSERPIYGISFITSPSLHSGSVQAIVRLAHGNSQVNKCEIVSTNEWDASYYNEFSKRWVTRKT